MPWFCGSRAGALKSGYLTFWVECDVHYEPVAAIARIRSDCSHSVGYVRMVHAGVGQAVAVCASTWRKVRASQGTVPGNAWEA